MKKTDIKPGVVYAYTRSREYGEPQPIVFLNTPADGELYRQPRRYGTSTGPAFTRDAAAPKPQRGGSYTSSPVGYPAALCRSGANGSPEDLLAVTLAHFEQATSAYGYTDDIELTVITSLGQILGPYAEAVAEYEERRAAQRTETERRNAAAANRRSRAKAAMEALADAGIFSAPRDGEIVLSLENAEKLTALLVRVGLAASPDKPEEGNSR
jgi:hypothetical protein